MEKKLVKYYKPQIRFEDDSDEEYNNSDTGCYIQ